ncbi:MAG: CorA family divalent cation transporter [Alphaproteobacteria bacterium]|nr:CorA family divalent cation transporter [Alphaproteobacteria bacterium]
MIEIYQRDADGVVRRADDCEIALTQAGLVWIDLDDPTETEERRVETALGIDVLTASERSAMEESARFYEENGALYLTTTLLGRRDEGPFRSGPVTFILTKDGTLVTVRHIRPRAFEIGEGRSSARIERARDGGDVMIALIEGCVERISDVIQESTASAHALSAEIFAENGSTPDLPTSLRTLGRLGMLAALGHDSLSSLQRAVAFSSAMKPEARGLHVTRLTALRRDIEQLERAIEAFQSHLTFLQEATLGLVNAAQSNTLKALSLATMAFVPPTLIASIFGMNFETMDWFKAPWGPWAGFVLMFIAPAALFAIAKWRRWF